MEMSLTVHVVLLFFFMLCVLHVNIVFFIVFCIFFSFQAMDGMQKAVAKNMEATMDVPVFRVSRKIRTDAFDDMYRQLKPKGVTVSLQ